MQPPVAEIQGWNGGFFGLFELLFSQNKRKGGFGMTIGDKIQYMRKKAGLSQEQLADAVGVSRQAVSKWETGVSHS